MKNYLRKLAFIAFFGMIISGCEKDLYEDNIKQQNTKYTYLTGKEALDVTNLLAQKMGENKTIGGRGLDLEDYGVVKYDVVMKVIDSLGNKTFTFRVDHPLATSEKFYNMVLQQKIDGLTMVKFYEYNMTTQFAEKYNKGEKEIKDFQGTYNYRLANFTYDIREGGGDDSGGGSGSGGDDSNIGGGPSGGASSGGGGGSPCPGNSGTIGGGGSGSGPGGGGGGSGGGGGTGGGGSASNCTTTTITVLCNGGGGHTGESTCTGSNHGYSISITICDGGGNGNRGINDADPCGGSGGAGGNSSGTGVLPPTIVPPTPCDQVKKLGDPTKNNIKPNVDSLKQKVNSSDNTNEIGFETKKIENPDETYTYVNTNVTSTNQFSIPITTYFNNIGGGHSHPIGSYPMFSFGDVKFLSEAYDSASPSRKDEVFYVLVCKDPSTGLLNTYSIRVDDINALINNVDATINNQTFAEIDNEEGRLEKIHLNQARTYSICGGDYEKSFLQQFAAFGIALYQATDDTMTHWSKLELDTNPNNPVKKLPCN